MSAEKSQSHENVAYSIWKERERNDQSDTADSDWETTKGVLKWSKRQDKWWIFSTHC